MFIFMCRYIIWKCLLFFFTSVYLFMYFLFYLFHFSSLKIHFKRESSVLNINLIIFWYSIGIPNWLENTNMDLNFAFKNMIYTKIIKHFSFSVCIFMHIYINRLLLRLKFKIEKKTFNFYIIFMYTYSYVER